MPDPFCRVSARPRFTPAYVQTFEPKGVILPDPDYWIAAHAVEERIPLASTDGHFKYFQEIALHLL